jgi:glucosamine kinase
MSTILIADSGSTKAEWCVIENGKKKKTIVTTGISPYFLTQDQIIQLLQKELLPKLSTFTFSKIFYYGTGLANETHVKMFQLLFKKLFGKASITVNHDLMGAAKALCGNQKGLACILGTGSNSCYYNGKKIVHNSPGLGFILGDEGSGAHMGKKVIQHFLYNTFDEDLMDRFNAKYQTNQSDIVTAVYSGSLPNKYLANYVEFLIENRGHYMVENIIEDSLSEFIFNHIFKYRESWTMPINFVGSVAYGFKDVLKTLCDSYELQLGKVLKKPMDGLIAFHTT